MGGGPSVVAGNNWRRLSTIMDARRSPIPVPNEVSSVLLQQDYHFAPCVASISLWSGKLLQVAAFPVKVKPTPAPTSPPRSPTGKAAEPEQQEGEEPSEEEIKARRKNTNVENMYKTEGGCRLILGSKEGVVRIFESSTRELLERGNASKCMILRAHIHSHEGQVHCVKLYDDANCAVSFGQDSKIILYDMQHRTLTHTIMTSHRGAILCGDISPDLTYALSAGSDGHLFLWDLRAREKLCTMGTRPHDKTRKYRATHLKILDDDKPWELGKAPWPGGKVHKDAVKCCAFVNETPTHRMISGGWDKKLLVWDLEKYASFTELEGHTGRISGCVASYDPRYCCSVSEDKTVRVWDLDDLACIAVLAGHVGRIMSCSMSSWAIYEPLLLTCGADGEFKMWDVRRQVFRDSLLGHYDSCLACSINQDGQYGVSVAQDGMVRIWRIRRLMTLNITLIVGEGGTGVTLEFTLTVDPQDDVLSAKEHLRLLTATPLSYDKEGEARYKVPDVTFRGLPPGEQSWTAFVNGRKKILDKDSENLGNFGLEEGTPVTVVRQVSLDERLALRAVQEEARRLTKGANKTDDESEADRTPGVSPTVRKAKDVATRKARMTALRTKGAVIDPNASFKQRAGTLGADALHDRGGNLKDMGLDPLVDDDQE